MSNCKYYDSKKGLEFDSDNFTVNLSPTDSLLGRKINDIEFNMDENLPEIIILLDNGSQIEIFKRVDGSIMIQSD